MVQSGSSETVFTYGAPQLKFGSGSSDEIAYDLSQYDVKRVLVITDPGVAATGHPQRVADQMGQFGIEAAVTPAGWDSMSRGSTIARVGRSSGWLIPLFTCCSSTSSTQTVVLSLPVPVVVGTATSGASRFTGARPFPTGAFT